MMMRSLGALFFGLLLGGCGGNYILTVPDQLVPPGVPAAAVVRLQRNDFFVLAPAVKGAAIRLRIAGGQERVAYTDKLGYAGTPLALPNAPGRYRLRVDYQDSEGEEIAASAPVYVWDPARPVVAVDLDCLPVEGHEDIAAAASALASLAGQANILYLTRRPIDRHGRAHESLVAAGYPDGAILLWQVERWHIVRGGKFKWPHMVVATRMVSQLPQLKRIFPKLGVGVCNSNLAAEAFDHAGMRCVVVGRADVEAEKATRRSSWAELASEGI